jgi:hypothetical protein
MDLVAAGEVEVAAVESTSVEAVSGQAFAFQRVLKPNHGQALEPSLQSWSLKRLEGIEG